MSDQSIAFVRHETLPPSPPPASETGIVKWMRENLFSSVTNSILTLAALYGIYSILSGSMPWILGGIWQAPSLQACREILAGDSAGCFAVLTERWHARFVCKSTASHVDSNRPLSVHRVLVDLGRDDYGTLDGPCWVHRRIYGFPAP